MTAVVQNATIRDVHAVKADESIRLGAQNFKPLELGPETRISAPRNRDPPPSPHDNSMSTISSTSPNDFKTAHDSGIGVSLSANASSSSNPDISACKDDRDRQKLGEKTQAVSEQKKVKSPIAAQILGGLSSDLRPAVDFSTGLARRTH